MSNFLFMPQDVGLILGVPCWELPIDIDAPWVRSGVGECETSRFEKRYQNKACNCNCEAMMRNLWHLVRERGEEHSLV